MELVKLESMRDELKREIDGISKELYDVKDKMEDILIEADYWTPKLRGDVLTFIEMLDFKTSQKNDMQKSLDCVLKEIKDHADTKVDKALGLERTECNCAECRAASAMSKTLAEGLIAAIRLKSKFEDEKEAEAEPENKSPNEIFLEGWEERIKPYREYLKYQNRRSLEMLKKFNKAEAEPEPEAKYDVSITELNGLIWCRSFNSLPEAKKFLNMCIQHPLHCKVDIRKG
jgi:hypothetical protein